MATQKGMSDYTLNLDGTNEQTINVQGDFVHVQAVSVDGTAVFLRFDEGAQVTRFKGQGNRVYYTQSVKVSASAACQVTLQLGYGYATDSRTTFDGSITVVDSPASTNPALPSVTVNAGAQAELVAADGTAVGYVVGVASSQPGGVFVGDIAAAADTGVFIEPGQLIAIGTQGALYAYNPGGSNVKVSIMGLNS